MPAMSFARPLVSSPLADSQTNIPPVKRELPKRASAFPSSRALRPFPAIAHVMSPKGPAATKPVKLIEPPANFKATFVLELTQAEFSRQE
ncbi:hypothetical protein CVT24_004729 [Panaeolus cyanescens]|uniref:Uncharacterized protein n=1 Tax=Panaeolus cyanescens TaxID=181874 RepID=A0A409V9S0_9AGAR|nr:hypothetical protein CVT24_004729 [Panaeolus cyanescens]